MHFGYCPLCGQLSLLNLGEPDRFTCVRCHHVFHIVDILERFAARRREPLLWIEDDAELERMAKEGEDQHNQEVQHGGEK